MGFKLYRMTAFAATSLACVFISFGIQVSAQEVEAESTTVETIIDGEAIPGDATTDAITINNPSIEVEDLELLAKPLTLEELQDEAAAWLILLKNKVQKISNTEIAVKHQNRKLDIQQGSLKLVEDAQTKLAAADKAQTANDSNSTAKLEEAKEALDAAIGSTKKLRAREAKLAENEALIESVRQGRKERGLNEAKEILKQASKIREDLATDVPQYQALTEGIDVLEKSINKLERADNRLDRTVPNSAAYQEAEAEAIAAREGVNSDREELRKIIAEFPNAIAESDLPTENLAEKAAKIETGFLQAISNLENIEKNLDIPNPAQSTFQEADQELLKLSDGLNQKIEKEDALKKQLVRNVTDLELERSGTINRFTAVLDALDDKGGDSESYRKYIDAASSVDLDLTDTEGLGVRLVSWLTSEDGGLNLILNIAKFGGILLLSVIIAPQIGKITNNILTRVGGISTLFRNFAVMIIKRGTVVLGFLLALAAIGVNLGPILALIGGASFILAFALQSNLANFASGLMLLINKPFDVGDEIKVSGYWAYVDSISLASTKLKDFGGSIITLPNNTVWGSDIINYTHADIRKIGLAIHVKFTQDLSQVRQMWMDIVAEHPKVLDTPAPSWFPWNGHYDYYVYINLTAWSKTDDYWEVYVDLLKELQKRIQDLDIQLTAPQQEIKLDKLLPETTSSQQTLVE
ncbi:MAG: mechanosensitive ion channel domain-containing protein [Cyanobacteria bacterium P01_F01_bin.143]